MKNVGFYGNIDRIPWKIRNNCIIKIGSLADDLSNASDFDAIIISGNCTSYEIEKSIWYLEKRLRKIGIDKIYVIPATIVRKPIGKLTLIDLMNYIVPIEKYSEPEVIKILAYEGCNLNCSGCSHFAPLNKKPHMLTLSEWEYTAKLLKNKFKYIKNIQFWGGEPLMNPDLPEMLLSARKLFKYSGIGVITNGLLLFQAKEVLDRIKECNVRLMVTLYHPLMPRIEELRNLLDSYKIDYEFSAEINYFRIQYNVDGHNDPEETHSKCIDWTCHTVRGSKISGCYYGATGEIANEYFGINLPHESFTYDLTSKMSGAEILRRLVAPNELCAYCNSFPSPCHDWHQASSDPPISDWFLK